MAEKNALAELSFRLIDAVTAIAETGLVAERHIDAINKSYRIVDELAKVDTVPDGKGNQKTACFEGCDAVDRCREIAEGESL